MERSNANKKGQGNVEDIVLACGCQTQVFAAGRPVPLERKEARLSTALQLCIEERDGQEEGGWGAGLSPVNLLDSGIVVD